MSSEKLNIVIFMGTFGGYSTEPARIAEWCNKELSNVNAVVVSDFRELADKGIKPDEVDGIILWMAFRMAIESFLKMCTEKKRLRWVQCSYTGMELTLCPGLVDDPSITVCISTDVYSNNLAEWVIAGIFYWEKFITRLQKQQKEHAWVRFYNHELCGKNMAVIGFGSIGQAAAKKATGLGVHVTGVRRRPVPEAEEKSTVSADIAERVVGNEKLMEIIPNMDYIVLVMPLTPKSRGMFGKEQFAAMKESAIFVNIGRGPTADYEALYQALHDHKIAAASVDVTDVEPLPPSSKLWDLENILISPHSCVMCAEQSVRCADFIMQNIRRFAQGEPLVNIVDKKEGY